MLPVVIILCLSVFWLPPRAGEKIVLGGVNAMLICLFLIFFAHSLPVLTDQTPLIGGCSLTAPLCQRRLVPLRRQRLLNDKPTPRVSCLNLALPDRR